MPAGTMVCCHSVCVCGCGGRGARGRKASLTRTEERTTPRADAEQRARQPRRAEAGTAPTGLHGARKGQTGRLSAAAHRAPRTSPIDSCARKVSTSLAMMNSTLGKAACGNASITGPVEGLMTASVALILARFADAIVV